MNEAEKKAQEGINQSLENADSKNKDWSNSAIKHIEALPKGFYFMAEDARKIAYSLGLSEPPSCRAWGGVIRRAVTLGIISRHGYGKTKNPNAHGTPASLWRRL